MTKKPTPTVTALPPEGRSRNQKPKGMSWLTLTQAYEMTQKIRANEGKPALIALSYDKVAARGVLAEGITKAVDGVIPPRVAITEATKSQLHEGICPETGFGIRKDAHDKGSKPAGGSESN